MHYNKFKNMTKRVKRLFEQFSPSNYQLDLDINESNLTFTGKVTITGLIKGRPTQRLTFHQKDLKINKASALHIDKKSVEKEIIIDRINLHKNYDEVRLHSKQMVFPGKAKITLEFSGKITDQMHGIYPCYFEHDGQKKKLIATQFESHHAREAFPCIDEPEAKATFDLTLTSPKNHTPLSNTPVQKQTKGPENTQITTFETTPVMSSYLLAFAVGEIHGVEGKTKDGTVVRSWASVAQPKSHLNYANKETIAVLEFLIDYFRTPFPLKKCDQIALPDFEVLAMENWGLITFREVGLLADPNNRSISGEQLISLVIAHELSHQWFGNLVTMKWWDDLWLNESFASLMEHLALDKLHPDWHEWENFTSGRVISAANRDIYKDVQAVGVGVNHPDEIMTLFDPSIVYAKGARLLKMLLDYIGEKDFRTSLKNYFKKHAFKNTTRDDLWAEFTKATGRDIGKLMTPWIEQSGTPLLSVKTNASTLELTQQRFLLDGKDNESLWPIPLLADNKLEPTILDKRSGTFSYDNNNLPLLNQQGSGHYIVKYEDEKQRKNQQSKIIDRSATSDSRIISINDMLLLAQRGDYSIVEILELISQCVLEDRDAVWNMFARSIASAYSLIDGEEVPEKHLRNFNKKLTKHWYDQLGWEENPSDSPNIKHLRSTVLAITIGGENPDAVKKAISMYEKTKSVEKLPADQRAMIAGAVVRFGDKSHIDSMMHEYETTQNPEIKDSITSALCSTRDKSIAKRLIAWALAEDGAVRTQDIDHWFAYLMRNRYTRELAWDWLTNNWNNIVKRVGGGKKMEYFIWYSSRPLSTKKWLKRYKDFFEPKTKQVALSRNIIIAFSEIEARATWREREEANIVAYLKKYQ